MLWSESGEGGEWARVQVLEDHTLQIGAVWTRDPESLKSCCELDLSNNKKQLLTNQKSSMTSERRMKNFATNLKAK